MFREFLPDIWEDTLPLVSNDMLRLKKYFTDVDFMPNLDIVNNEKDVQIKVDLPGMTEKNINVEYANGVVSIKGERKKETQTMHRCERSYGSFVRNVRVSDFDIDPDSIVASFKDGVLNITLSKKEAAETKQISISS